MGKITFIVGGARSGKSDYALKLAGKSEKRAFVATGEARDNEMRRRIKLHKASRPKNWATFEAPLDTAATVKKIPPYYSFVIIDCLTLLVSNMLLNKKNTEDIEKEVLAILKSLKKRKGCSAIVSNEVGLGIVPDNRLARGFRDIAGKINKLAAAYADDVFFMVSGIPWRIK